MEVYTQTSDKIDFRVAKKARKVVIKKGYAIKDSAFENSVMEEINIEDASSIGKNAFRSCTNLRVVVLPEGLKTVPEGAFWGCKSLEIVIFPKSLKTISTQAFGFCTSLKKIIFNDNLSFIRKFAFIECENLEEFNIPKKLKEIHDSAFYSCRNIRKIHIQSKNFFEVRCPAIWSYDLTHITVDDEIDKCYFPENLQSIDKESTETLLDKYIEIQKGMFSDNKHIEFLKFDRYLEEIGQDSFRGSSVKTVEDINCDILGSWAFEGCENLEKVTMKKCRVIGKGSFHNCPNLREVVLSDDLEIINSEAFDNCPNLDKIVIGKNIKIIMGNSFSPNTKIYFNFSKEEFEALRDKIEKESPLFNLSSVKNYDFLV